MRTENNFTYKIAEQEGEFTQIHRLNYETFVEEIPQHQRNPEGILVDKFHEQNTYLICLKGEEVIGMGAIRTARPFSLDQKLGGVDQYINVPYQNMAEIRLLVMKKDYRFSRASHNLLIKIIEFCYTNYYDLGIVSATTKQLKLYAHMGFEAFGPLVGDEKAQFQPMFIKRKTVEQKFPQVMSNSKSMDNDEHVLLQPGPVKIKPEVQCAFIEPSISHRSERFRLLLQNCKKLLCELVNAQHVEIMMGSGTLGNDIVVGQLLQLPGRGLIISNGEFGERLIDHATRVNADFTPLRFEWGQSFDAQLVEQTVQQQNYQWLWATHCETSTGIINDIAILKTLCQKYNVLLALDCTSSIGTVPVDLNGVFLASSVSGKGLCSYAGLTMVYHQQHLPAARKSLPRYLDLREYISKKGIPYTLSSHLLRSLEQALMSEQYLIRQKDIKALSQWLEAQLLQLNIKVIGKVGDRNPAVITMELPKTLQSSHVGDQLVKQGYILSYQSQYLVDHNWLQICLFGGSYTQAMFNKMFVVLNQCIKDAQASTVSI